MDVPYPFLYYFFKESDKQVEQLARDYRDGALLSSELKEIAAAKIADFLEEHQKRRAALGSLDEEVLPYRLTESERQTVLQQIEYSDDLLV